MSARQDGFTLIELLLAMTIGTVVMLATLGLVDSAMPASKRVTDRVEASQIGRSAMEQVMRDLRSAVCVYRVGGTYVSPLTAGTSNANQVTFYRQIFAAPGGGSDPGKTGTVQPQKVILAVSGGRLTETVYDPQGVGPFASPTPADWTWNGTPTTKVLASNVQQVSGGDYFTYFAYAPGAAAPTGAPPALAIGAGDVAVADEPRIVKVKVQFLAGPLRTTSNGTDHYVSLRDEAAMSQPVDFTSGDTASQGGKCTL